MWHFLVTVFGQLVRAVARLRGGGSALPGLVIEKLDRGYLPRLLSNLPYGVVIISGTNGKTTTAKIVTELLTAQGLRVFTNKTGSNFARGIVAASLAVSDWRGKLNADIAVLELDEAHAMHFIDRVRPANTLLLNVLRDQLDRFGELDTTAAYLERIAKATTKNLVVNREDPHLLAIANKLENSAQPANISYFGVSEKLKTLFVSDDQLHAAEFGVAVPNAAASLPKAAVQLLDFDGRQVSFSAAEAEYSAQLQLEGSYNFLNAAAAVALVLEILGDRADPQPLFTTLEKVKPAFGRGEALQLDGQKLELVLVKNPAGFRLALSSFDPCSTATMIAINDQYADGRDMSWLWDVDFKSLKAAGVDTVSGSRAWDMTLRLEHDEVSVSHTDVNLGAALATFRQRTPGVPRRIFCTYTAMLEIRAVLAEITEVENVW